MSECQDSRNFHREESLRTLKIANESRAMSATLRLFLNHRHQECWCNASYLPRTFSKPANRPTAVSNANHLFFLASQLPFSSQERLCQIKLTNLCLQNFSCGGFRRHHRLKIKYSSTHLLPFNNGCVNTRAHCCGKKK